MDVLPLNVELADLLNGHGVTARVDGDRVELPALGTWADLRLIRFGSDQAAHGGSAGHQW